MSLPIKSIIICLVVLATASDIHTLHIQEVGKSKILVASVDKTILIGTGVEQNQVPIIGYFLTTKSLDVSVYVQSKKPCDLKFDALNVKRLNIRAVKQFTSNTIVFAWSIRTKKDITVLSVIDTDVCRIKKNIESDLPITDTMEVVPFVNGFDIITSENLHTSYDINGNVMGDKEFFPLQSRSFSISAVSGATRAKGFFVVDYTSALLNLVDFNGRLLKPLLAKLPAKVLFTNNDESLYSTCWFDTGHDIVVNCRQYDQGGNEQWKVKVKLAFKGNLKGDLGMKNLAGGRLALVALNGDGNKLSFYIMGPEEINTWSYTSPQVFEGIGLTDFIEDKRTFVLACHFFQIKRGVNQELLVSKKFALLT